MTAGVESHDRAKVIGVSHSNSWAARARGALGKQPPGAWQQGSPGGAGARLLQAACGAGADGRGRQAFFQLCFEDRQLQNFLCLSVGGGEMGGARCFTAGRWGAQQQAASGACPALPCPALRPAPRAVAGAARVREAGVCGRRCTRTTGGAVARASRTPAETEGAPWLRPLPTHRQAFVGVGIDVECVACALSARAGVRIYIAVVLDGRPALQQAAEPSAGRAGGAQRRVVERGAHDSGAERQVWGRGRVVQH